MEGIGLPQAEDFGAAKVIACVLFGAIGFVALAYGKKNRYFRTVIIGVALMAYPYFVSGTLPLYLVGIVLTAMLYLWRD